MACPRRPSPVDETVAEAADAGKEDNDRPWWMKTEGDVGDYVGGRCKDGNSTLAKGVVKPRVCECGDGVTDKGTKEDERHDCVGQIIVWFELWVYQWKARQQCS